MPTPKQQSWWTKYAAQLGCEAVQTVDKGEEIVTAYGLSILAGGGGAYRGPFRKGKKSYVKT